MLTILAIVCVLLWLLVFPFVGVPTQPHFVTDPLVLAAVIFSVVLAIWVVLA